MLTMILVTILFTLWGICGSRQDKSWTVPMIFASVVIGFTIGTFIALGLTLHALTEFGSAQNIPTEWKPWLTDTSMYQ